MSTVSTDLADLRPGAPPDMLDDRMRLSREEQLSLVEAARSGTAPQRAAAVQELLADFRPFAMAVIDRTLAAAGVGREHAEDAWLQATFRLYTTGLTSFAGDAAPRSYFLRIALHAAIDVVRDVLRRPPPAVETTADPVGERLEAEEHVRALEALRLCLTTLTDEHAEAVRLYYLEETGACKTCAARVGISTLAFMKRLERARAHLQRCVRARLVERAAGGRGVRNAARR
jgi:RNA polymerase sigma factor (sigma-70 family)